MIRTLIRAAAVIPALLLSAVALAEEEGASTATRTPDTVGTVISLGLGLLVVIAVIFLCAWLARRVQGLQGANTQAMKVVSVLSVGQRERVALIDVGGQQILVGITPQSVRTLHVFDEPVVERRDAAGHGDFASKLQAMLARGASGGVTRDDGSKGSGEDR